MNITNKPLGPIASSRLINSLLVDTNLKVFAFQPKLQTGVVRLTTIYSLLNFKDE
jgi:hypothetical protein